MDAPISVLVVFAGTAALGYHVVPEITLTAQEANTVGYTSATRINNEN